MRIDLQCKPETRVVGVRTPLHKQVTSGRAGGGCQHQLPVCLPGGPLDQRDGFFRQAGAAGQVAAAVQGHQINSADPRVEPQDAGADVQEQIPPRVLSGGGQRGKRGQMRIVLIGPLRRESVENMRFGLQFGQQLLALQQG